VQVNYLVYPGTTGASFMDIVLADRIVLPADQQPFFSEKIVHLPDCYQANDGTRIVPPAPTRAEAGLPEEGFVFCCFNNNWKITAPVFDIWMRLLTQVPGSVLWLLDGPAAANLRAEAAARGLDAGRLVFAPKQPPSLHLARHQLADLFLDTLPYNAHTTCSDALWAGLPVVTCYGKAFPGRVAASLLKAIELPELVTVTPEKYEELALELANNPALLKATREKLARNRTTTPLFDSNRFRKAIEDAYKTLLA
jgi:predicted O-linked N-acetylglucosamine transferase (SPINDLY family)